MVINIVSMSHFYYFLGIKSEKMLNLNPNLSQFDPITVIFPLFWPLPVNAQTFLITLSLLLPSIMLMTPFDLC